MIQFNKAYQNNKKLISFHSNNRFKKHFIVNQFFCN